MKTSISKEMTTVKLQFGHCIFKLGYLLDKKNISINKFIKETQTDFKTIKKHANGDVQQIDLMLIDRWCHYLNCSINEIFEYIQA